MSTTIRNRFLNAFRWGVTFCLICFVVSRLDTVDIEVFLKVSTALTVLLAACVVTVVVFLNSVRWHAIASIFALPMVFGQAFLWTLIGHFFNQRFPTSFGGNVVRGLYAARQTGQTRDVVTSLTLERTVGILVLLIMIAAGQPFILARFQSAETTGIALACVMLGFFCIAVFFIFDKVSQRLKHWKIVNLLAAFSKHARTLLRHPRI